MVKKFHHDSLFDRLEQTACSSNVRVMKIEIDDVPWKDELAARAHPWDMRRVMHSKNLLPAKSFPSD